MRVFCYIFNTIIILGIIVYIAIVGIQGMKSTVLSTSLDVKQLKSSELLDFNRSEKVDVDEDIINKEEKEVIQIDEKDFLNEDDKEVIIEEVSSSGQEELSDVLEIQVGSLSGYGPDCVGCSGFLASGLDVRNENIYYSDSTYGNVRILAGDKAYPYGTIVRVKNSRLSEFIGIVLDRGGAIGFGKSHLFDLLYQTSSEALKNEVSYNTTFEILRYGY